MPPLRATTTVVVLVAATACCLADGRHDDLSAAQLFEQTLASEGLDAAVASLEAALADSAVPHAIDARELAIALPARLVVNHQRAEALALVLALETLFGDDPRYWQLVGEAHLRCSHEAAARTALERAAAAGGRPDLEWMLAHLDQLVATTRLQAEREDRLVPGEPTGLDGPYLGQRPPGQEPEPFAPGILSTTAHEYHLSFAPDGREILFSRGGAGTLVSRWTDAGWTVPEVVHLIDAEHLTEEANLTADGRAVVFCGRRDLRSPRVLYRAERTADGWGPPTELFPGMYATTALDGSLYYTQEGEGRDYGAIVRRAWNGEDYDPPELVAGEGINSPAPDAHPWIAPDQSLLLFDSYRDPGAGIYAAFRGPGGDWCPAVLLNDRLGIPPAGQCAMSPDGEYLFFCLAGDMYWVDAAFLDDLRRECLGD